MSDVFDFRIRTCADLVRAVEQFGFVPFFKNRIQGFSLAEIDVPEVCIGKTLAEADLRKKNGVTVLCIRRPDPRSARNPRQIVIPSPGDAFQLDDKLIVFGTTAGIDAISGKD